MSMMNTGDILETIEMFTQDNLDVRTALPQFLRKDSERQIRTIWTCGP